MLEWEGLAMGHLGREAVGGRALLVVLGSLLAACANLSAPRALIQDAPVPQDPDAEYASEFYGHPGIALGVRGHGAQLGGDFDGDTTLVGPRDSIFLPDTDTGLGYELVLNFMDEGAAFELGYTRVEHDGEFAGLDSDVEYRAFTARGLYYWRANSRLQPLAFIGLLYPLIDVQDGSSDGVAVGTAKLTTGFGVEGGVGLGWWLSRRLLLDLRAYAVYQEFERAEGVQDDAEDVDDAVEAPLYGLTLGLTYVLRRKQ
jgi:opacity protein-like surface antigen